ncbi:threonine synthase [Helicobacter mustelae]|uniref:Threonine synthase n=1 Tax=Helicobacter mustelae (strain ATCC 43772 / CCUG 25715 / CIP 103759 / LMG 18044 / NCTC 12198 / R85-136P) TaxID=679897 RepID=D3UJ68_HELM1|nr:threonine synthase [Helicobacter mustelae]CBG40543.1 threonine synthase [Helicobacter mustelae 12198]SQH72041.1 threonine synthase [Helicobacter mustelae]
MLSFVGTRDQQTTTTFKQALLHQDSPHGGLWVPQELPKIDFEKFTSLSYTALCKSLFEALDLGVEDSLLNEALKRYESFDDPSNPAPLHPISPDLSIQELYHGRTRAFKDMALAPFGALFSALCKQEKQQYLILAATSGDTGPAALDSFANLLYTKVVCLYPKGGTSDVQELQMITQNAKNLFVFGIEGNFDDAQSILKSLIQKKDFHKKLKDSGHALSVANSVNFGRIIFQILYHIWGYLHYLKERNLPYGVMVKTIIPSGNFGNALGAFYAKKMGLPIEKILIATNKNNILHDFITTGSYDISKRQLLHTYSPAMDILKSSNVERVLFALFGANKTRTLMQELEEKKSYTLSKEEHLRLQKDFESLDCSDTQCLEILKKYYFQNILIDPHTANAIHAYEKLKGAHNIVCSTAEWSKFAPIITKATTGKMLCDKDAIAHIEQTQSLTPSPHIQELFEKKILHQKVLHISSVEDAILELL